MISMPLSAMRRLAHSGRAFCRQSGPRAHLKLLKRWPSVHVLATAGVAADHYASGTFWPKLVALLGVRGDQAFHREWGGAFLENLEHLGLPTFRDDGSDAGTKFVGRILMHSGMPTYCLADFYRLVTERRRRTPGLSPEEFVAWAGTRASVGQLPHRGQARGQVPSVRRGVRHRRERAGLRPARRGGRWCGRERCPAARTLP